MRNAENNLQSYYMAYRNYFIELRKKGFGHWLSTYYSTLKTHDGRILDVGCGVGQVVKRTRYLRLFTYRALRQFLTFYHFNIVKVEGVASEGLPRALSQIDRAISRIPSLASSVIVFCKKSQ